MTTNGGTGERGDWRRGKRGVRVPRDISRHSNEGTSELKRANEKRRSV